MNLDSARLLAQSRLWRSVIDQLEDAERYTKDNDRLTLQFCVNYGGRAEIVDAVRAITKDALAGKINPAKIDERPRHR